MDFINATLVILRCDIPNIFDKVQTWIPEDQGNFGVWAQFSMHPDALVAYW